MPGAQSKSPPRCSRKRAGAVAWLAVGGLVVAALLAGCGTSSPSSGATAVSVLSAVRIQLGEELTNPQAPSKLFVKQPALAAAMRAEAKLQPRVKGFECQNGFYVIVGRGTDCGYGSNIAAQFLLTTGPRAARDTLHVTDPVTYRRITFRCRALSNFGPYECAGSGGLMVYLLSYRAPITPRRTPRNRAKVYNLA